MQVVFGQINPDQVQLQLTLSRFSPSMLYGEAVQAILHPTTRSLGLVFVDQLQGAIGTPLALGQSLLLVWPQMTGLVAAAIILFVIAYVAFQRQEVRA
jgi:ABC-2 type transport system permease protein